MSFAVWDSSFDVAIAAGPRIKHWPSIGVQTLSALCSEMGLTVGVFGGNDLTVYGLIPLPTTGGLLFGEDSQNRIHRIKGRAIVRVQSELDLPTPFPGSNSQGLIPIDTADWLWRNGRVTWNPAVVVLGSGNRGLRFGSLLLESGSAGEVFCIESPSSPDSKTESRAWEVERRRFEMLGGKILFAKPLELLPLGPLLWQLRVEDSIGVRLLNVSRVVSAGPFDSYPDVREYPPGSFLFEFQQRATLSRVNNVKGWVEEEERARWLAIKIIKNLAIDLGEKRELLDRSSRKNRLQLKLLEEFQKNPVTLDYDGKWCDSQTRKKIQKFSGTPQQAHQKRLVATLECFEDIACNYCEKACPTSAISLSQGSDRKQNFLNEIDCTACGLCLEACPSGVAYLIQENHEGSHSRVVISCRGSKNQSSPWKKGDTVLLLNRKGEQLGSARVLRILEGDEEEQKKETQLVEVEVPSHLIWEARAIKPHPSQQKIGEVLTPFEQSEKVEITLNGEKRLVREGISISLGLFEMGRERIEDRLLCPDGSCGLCQIWVDGVKKTACKEKTHQGMTIRFMNEEVISDEPSAEICPCLGLSLKDLQEQLEGKKHQSPEALLFSTHLGEGICHGMRCVRTFRRVIAEAGAGGDRVENWVDWRFPWSEWILKPGPSRGAL